MITISIGTAIKFGFFSTVGGILAIAAVSLIGNLLGLE